MATNRLWRLPSCIKSCRMVGLLPHPYRVLICLVRLVEGGLDIHSLEIVARQRPSETNEYHLVNLSRCPYRCKDVFGSRQVKGQNIRYEVIEVVRVGR